MADKKTLKMSLAGLTILIVVVLFASVRPSVTPSATNACKETMPNCSKKTGAETKTVIDLESLSGKFFSSVSY